VKREEKPVFTFPSNFNPCGRVLLSSMYVLQPVKFTSFPNLLLLTTLSRLALNVATSRLILTNGESGTGAVGTVIRVSLRESRVEMPLAQEIGAQVFGDP
jgi:hypothetical protein